MQLVPPTLACQCGHLGEDHQDSIQAPCLVPGCGCDSFDEQEAIDE